MLEKPCRINDLPGKSANAPDFICTYFRQYLDKIQFFKEVKMNRFSTMAAAAALALSATSAMSATVVNGSFEDITGVTLNSSGWSFFSSIPGWTGSPTGEVQSAPTISAVDAQDGKYYVELDTNQNSTIFQDIAFDAGKYKLSFWYSPRVPAAHNPSGSTNDMTFAVGSLLSGSVTGAPNPTFPRGVWTEVSSIFTVATAGTYRLSFSGAGAENESNGCGDCGALIDNVSISAVPLPASALFLLAGIGGLGALRARRRAA
jgi:hypothetical protein